MKKFLFIALVFIISACSDEDESAFSPAVYRLGNTTFQITATDETYVDVKCISPVFSAYSIKFDMDGSDHSYIYVKNVTETIDVRYPFTYIKIKTVQPILY